MNTMLRQSVLVLAVALYGLTTGANAADAPVLDDLKIDVRLYGIAAANSGTENTAALNALFAKVPDGSTIVFPSGVLVFDPGIALAGKDGVSKGGLRIEGQGHGKGTGSTYWRASGSGDRTATLFEISASHNIDISNITFWGNADNSAGKTGIGTYIHRGEGYTSAIKFTNCYWRAFEVGTQIGHLTVNESNNENMDFYSCQWLGNTVGYRQYWQNSLLNAMYSPIFTNNGTNIWLGSTLQTGSLHLYNANFAVTDKTDIYFEKPASLSIYGARSETTPSFISDSGTFGSVDFPSITLSNVMMVNKTSPVATPIVKISTGGLVAINCHFGEYNEAVARIESRPATATLSFVGCQFNGLLDDVFRPARANSGILSFMGCRQWSGAGYVPVADNANGPVATLSNATPAVNNTTTFFTGNQAAPMTITDFVRSSGAGQVLYVIVNDNNTTIKNNDNISLIGGVDVKPPNGGRMVFVLMDKWYEMSRSW